MRSSLDPVPSTQMTMDTGSSGPGGIENELLASTPELEALKAEIERVNLDLLEREHRWVRVLWNIRESRTWDERDPKRAAVWKALFWRVLTPTAAVAGGAFLATVIAFLSYRELRIQTDAAREQVAIGNTQNRLISEQNEYLRNQIRQQAAQHFRTTHAQLTATLYESRECSPEEAASRSDPWQHLDHGDPIVLSRQPRTSDHCPVSGPRARADAALALVSLERAVQASPADWPSVFLLSPSHADLKTADLSEIAIPGADLGKTDLYFVTFLRATLSDAQFDEALVTETDFRRANLDGATFRHAALSGSYFHASEMNSAKLIHASVHRCTFISARLNSADLTEASVSRSSFGHFIARNATFDDATFEQVDLESAFCNSCSFVGGQWTAVNARDANLAGSDFAFASLEGVSLEGSTLDGVDFSQVVKFEDVSIDGCRYCPGDTLKATRWPHDFDERRLTTCSESRWCNVADIVYDEPPVDDTRPVYTDEPI
jgi:uncharacterized protein YjbI with pentapeptide repeats